MEILTFPRLPSRSIRPASRFNTHVPSVARPRGSTRLSHSKLDSNSRLDSLSGSHRPDSVGECRVCAPETTLTAFTEVAAMSTVVDLRKTDDPRDAIHRAVQLLAAGHLVAFPTETVYAACAHALVGSAVKRLYRSAARNKGSSDVGSKGIAGGDRLRPAMDRLGQRLARRCWPGPVTLAFDVGLGTGLFSALPRRRACTGARSRLWIRVPAHECIQEVLRLMPAPLSPEANAVDEHPP